MSRSAERPGAMKTDRPNHPTNQTIKRTAYSLAAGAAGAATLAVGEYADAQIIWSTEPDFTVYQGGRAGFDVDLDGTVDLYLQNYVFSGVLNYQGIFVRYGPGQIVGFNSGLNYATALVEGDPIDATTVGPSFSTSLAYPLNANSQFDNAEGAYIGFSFPNGPDLFFGWLRVTIDNAAGEFVVTSSAYESTPGVGILAGDIGSTGIPGDFNNDGIVDAADYTFWRDNLGATFDADAENPLAANGDNNGASEGVVDSADYLVWKGNFGADSPPEEPSAAAAPEPMTLGLLAAGSLGLTLLRQRRRDDSGDNP